MLFSEAIQELPIETGKSKTDSEVLEKVKASLNFSKIEVSKSYHWKELERPSELLVLPYYKTGSATITQESRTVTLTGGATVSADFTGRFFKPDNGTRWYLIRYADVANNQIILESPIIEDSSSTAYRIWKKFYRIPTDVRVVLPDVTQPGFPIPFEIKSYNLAAGRYNTGTITITENSNVFTGTGTAFLDNIFPGDTLVIEGKIFHVKTVDMDTRGALANVSDITLTASYYIESEAPVQAFTESVLEDERNILPYTYIRHLYKMVHDNDSTELSTKFDRTFIDIAKAEYLRMTNSEKWVSEMQLGLGRLEKLKLDSELTRPAYKQFKSHIPHFMPGRGLQ